MKKKQNIKKKAVKKVVKKGKLKVVKKKKTLAEKLNLRDETVHFSMGVLLIFIAIFLIAAAVESAGPVGNFLYNNFEKLMGVGYYLLPLSAIIFSIVLFKDIKKKVTKIKIFGFALFLISGLGFIELVFSQGGYFGTLLAKTEIYLGPFMSVILSIITLVISQIIIFDGVPKISIFRKTEELEYSENLPEQEEEKILKSSTAPIKSTKSLFFNKKKKEETDSTIEKKEEKKVFKISAFEKNKSKDEGENMTEKIKSNNLFSNRKVVLPPINLLSKDKGKVNAGDVQERANLIKSTLFSFGISVEIEAVSVGPTVTRYSLRPAVGVKVSKIAALNDDLALALAAKSIIIQTPIPGQSLVGIEIPNKNAAMVGAGSLFASSEFQNSEFDLPLAIGKDIGGETTVIGMEKTPHMLIAGATGAGKSVTVHAIINSMLFKHGPDSLKFILIDPKRVEMTLYEGIPHLLTPVIKDPKKAILSLR
jgi:S-DNA-T family DNA segregation ATPase FtsK/SpoIIIE